MSDLISRKDAIGAISRVEHIAELSDGDAVIRTCNDCFLSMQNCHDKSICCEDETGLCDYFEEIPEAKEEGEQDG